MSFRVDLYPVSLPRLVSLFGKSGWERARPIVEEMRKNAEPLDEKLLDALLSGRLSASRPTDESGELAWVIAHLAYGIRDPNVEVLFDIGNVWNALESLELEGELESLARALLDGRPLIGEQIVSDWNSYAWVSARELDTFASLLERARALDPAGLAHVEAWLKPVRERKLNVFVALG